MSGGQRQRVVIAIALACGPDLLIADEPTTALDVTVQREVLDLIGELVAERGMGLLLISHNLGVMARTVRRLMVMYGGIVAESGPDRRACSRAWRIPTRARCSPRGRAWGWRAARGCRRFPGGCPNWPTCPRVVRSPTAAPRGRRVPRAIPPALPVSAPGRTEALTNRSAQREGPLAARARCALRAHARRARGGACLSRWSSRARQPPLPAAARNAVSPRRRWCARSTT